MTAFGLGTRTYRVQRSGYTAQHDAGSAQRLSGPVCCARFLKRLPATPHARHRPRGKLRAGALVGLHEIKRRAAIPSPTARAKLRSRPALVKTGVDHMVGDALNLSFGQWRVTMLGTLPIAIQCVRHALDRALCPAERVCNSARQCDVHHGLYEHLIPTSNTWRHRQFTRHSR